MPRKLPKTNSAKAALIASVANTLPKGTLYFAAPVELKAAAAGTTGDAALPTFDTNVYTGVPMRVSLYGTPTIIELSGIAAPKDQYPALRDHDSSKVVGHTTKVRIVQGGKDKGLHAEGVVSGTGADAAEIVSNSKNGFTWQMSIGCDPDRVEYLDSGKTAKVNGISVSGPLIIVRAATLKEVSFVALGADGNTSASVAAKLEQENVMNFKEWLKANGFAEETLSAERLAVLEAMFNAGCKPEGLTSLKATWAAADAAQPKPPTTPTQPTLQAGSVQATVAEHRAAIAAESKRIADIRRICAGAHPDIEAKAIEDGSDPLKVELEVLKAARPQAPAGHVHAHEVKGDVLEAALCMTLKLPEVEKKFDAKTLEAAHKRHRNLGIQEFLLNAAAANGMYVGPGMRITAGNLKEVLMAACVAVGMQANASSIDVAGILSNVANKEIVAGYMEEDQTWREVAAIRSVSDFKAVTTYRMLDDMEYEEIGPDGEIKHGTLGEESYTRQVKTFAKMGELTRPDIINDDLGVFNDLRTRLGAGAGKKLNKVFWTRWLNNAAFFTANRGNYITGGTTNLGVDGVGLQLGITAFRKLKSPAADGAKKLGNTVGGRPSILLVPPELEFTAQKLHQNTNIGQTKNDEANIHAGKYKPVVSDWLSDADYPGYSSTAWYLLRAPTTLAGIVVSFLNGVETPTVESAAADFNRLGIQLRGFHDFGVDLAEYLCGIKSKGAA